MPTLPNYSYFGGINWETSTIHNALAYAGVKVPHNNEPISEAVLFGISGGVMAAYFTFDWHGGNPHFHFLTHDTFDPFPRILDALGIKAESKQTDKPEKAVQNLVNALEDGKVPIVWADISMLPYANRDYDEQDWWVIPLIVYGLEADAAYISDRATVSLTVTPDELQAARGRVKKEKHRLMTLGTPDLSRLPEAVEAGIRRCIAHFTEPAPLKPLQGKFGFDAYRRWADWLVDPKNKEAWPKKFAGSRLYTGLTSGYEYIELMGTGGNASRKFYATFLNDAAAILGNEALKTACIHFSSAAIAWDTVTNYFMLPDDIPVFKQARELMARSYQLFDSQGAASLPERQAIKAQLKALNAEAIANPLSEAQAKTVRENLREMVLKVLASEQAAIESLQAAMG